MDFMEHARLEVALTKAREAVIIAARAVVAEATRDRLVALGAAIAAVDDAIADIQRAQTTREV